MRKLVRHGALSVVFATAAVLASARVGAAQQSANGIVTGKVVDAGSQNPLPSAQVFITGTQIGAVTNASGDFRIPNAPAGPVTLSTRLIGYAPVSKPVTVTAGQTTTVNFAMSQSALTLNEVVTTGAGAATQEKKLGNTVAKVDVSDLQFAPIQSPSEILQGRIPGVSALPSGGLTGEGTRIRIRGNASLSQSNEPVYYIDGVRMDPGGGFGRIALGGGSPSRIDDIDPASIARIEVLKGAAAATLYGTEASNGVVQIFTKSGVSGPPRYTLEVERSSLSYPDRIQPAAGFARRQSQADSLSKFYGRTIAPFQIITTKPSDLLMETGYGNTATLSATGGTTGISYFASGRYQYEDGPYTSKRFDGNSADIARKYQGTVNLTLFPRDNLRIGLRNLYTDSHQESPPNNNNTFAPLPLADQSKPELANCRASALPGDGTYGLLSPGVCKGPGNPLGQAAFASVREATLESIKQDASHYNGVVNANLLPFPSVALDGTFGLDYTSARNVDFLPFGNYIDKISPSAFDPNGSRNLDNVVTQNITLDVRGTWTRDLTPTLNSVFVFGGQGFINDQHENTAFSHNFAGPAFEVVGAGVEPTVFESYLRNVNAGYFAQEQLGWHDWTFLTVGGRYDKNSAFGQNAGGVFYPKLSLSIVPSDRPGYDHTLLSTIRFRGAIGKSGRQPGAFDKFTTYTALAGGLVQSNLGNPNLKPEVSTEWEAGAETGFFSNKIGFNVTYWNRTVNDALVAKQYPPSGGFFTQQLANIGKLGAHGWELGTNAYLVNRPNLGVDVFANGAYLWQKVLSMGGAAPIKVGGSYPRYRNFLKEGYPPGALLGAELMQPCSSYKNPATQAKGGCLQPGQYPIDVNGDGKPDTQADLLAYFSSTSTTKNDPSNIRPVLADDNGNGDLLDSYLGKPTPDWQGALGGNVRVGKNWRLSTLFEFKAGNYTITDLTYAFRASNATIGRNTVEAATLEATLINPASTPDQRAAAAKDWIYHNRTLVEAGLNQNFPGDFMRWRELSLTYIAPARFVSRLAARDVSITLAARNLLLWTKYPGLDPEVNVIGRGGAGTSTASGLSNNYLDAVELYGFPIPRRFSLSVRVGF